MNTRVRKLGPVTVEHLNCRDYGPANWRGKPRLVQHTTEGGFESSLAILRRTDTPTFLAGRDKTGKLRCVQFIDVGRTAGALEHPPGTGQTNALCVAQIELVAFSQKTRWLPDAGVTDLLAHLYAWLHEEWGVPLVHVPAERDRKVFESNAGVYGHADVPDQPKGHWDPGDFDYAAVCAAAKRLTERPAWYDAAAKLQPLYAWMLWRDHGSPSKFRPAQIPPKVPKSWFPRYVLHKGL